MHSVYEGMIALVLILEHTYTKRQMSISVDVRQMKQSVQVRGSTSACTEAARDAIFPSCIPPAMIYLNVESTDGGPFVL